MKPHVHPYVPELQDLHRRGKISRREFIQFAALLGVSSAGVGSLLAGCAPIQAPVAPAAPAAATAAPAAAGAAATAVKRGGELRVSGNVYKLTDPATSVIVEYNVWWFVNEYLTFIDEDNVTHPVLLEKWEASDDLKTWTLSVRKGIKFNHGKDLTADDVVWNLKRWLDPATKSSMAGVLGGYMTANDVEKVDDFTVKMHLKTPQIGVPEHLAHNVAGVLPKDWPGDWVKNPWGTGPFTLAEYNVGERAVLKRRDGYWQNGVDGKPLPYLDAIRMVYLGNDAAPAIAALSSGDIDVLTAVQPPLVDAIKKNANVVLADHVSAYTHVYRMRADKKPFDDVRVRQAIKLCQDRQQILDATQRGYGALGEDHHVSPIQPEYTKGEPPARDIEKAKALLKEAGYADGLNIKLATMDAEPVPTMAQLLKDQCAPAGINIELTMMPESMYWDQWTDVDFGITSWTHRPSAVMTLGLAYRTGAEWNECHWSDKEFDDLISQAEGTLDVPKRREIVAKIQKIMQDRGPVAIPRWNSQLLAFTKDVKGLRAAVHDHLMAYGTWIDKA